MWESVYGNAHKTALEMFGSFLSTEMSWIVQSLHSIDNNKQVRFGRWCWVTYPFDALLELVVYEE